MYSTLQTSSECTVVRYFVREETVDLHWYTRIRSKVIAKQMLKELTLFACSLVADSSCLLL